MNCTPQSLIEASKCFDCIPPGMQGAVQTILTCEWTQGGGGGGCDDPVVLDWLQRLANDFQPMPSQATINAVCDFCTALRLAGIMDKMLVVNPIIPDSFLAMRYPLIYQAGNGNSPFINVSFVAADLNNDGLLGDASSKYMDTGFNPRTHWGAAISSGGITVYESEADPVGNPNMAVGCRTVASDEYFFIEPWDDTIPTSTLAGCWDAASTLQYNHADTPSFYSSTRTSNVLYRLYQANTGLGPNVVLRATNVVDQTANTIPNRTAYFMAINDAVSGAAAFSNQRISFMAIHDGLSATEVQSLYEAVYDLRFALGGGYV